MQKYSVEELEYIKSIYKKHVRKDVAVMVNEKFGTNRTYGSIKYIMQKLGLKNGINGKFQKGHVTWNKGKQINYVTDAMRSTQFKKGQIPKNKVQVGHERITVYGYTEIKVAEPSTFKLKHRILWEEYNNKKIPKGYVVIFANRDKQDFRKDNLVLISRGKLAELNKRKYIDEDETVTKCYITLLDLEEAIKSRR